MTVSAWRFAHLALALFSCIFLALASITGAILAVDAVNEKLPSYGSDRLNTLTLAESLPVLRKAYSEITEISVDHNGFVTLKGFDDESNDVSAYINPATGKTLGIPGKKSDFIQSVTSLHRSLFLHEAGRFFVGLITFLLVFITVSGTVLLIQRQRGLRRFFSRIVKDYFAQYYHVLAGRLLLIPILILALSGTYLSMERFHLFPEDKTEHQIDASVPEKPPVRIKLSDFDVFKQTSFAEVEKLVFPFTDDPEEYFTLKLKDRELILDQFSGKILSEITYSPTSLLANLSLDLHTGRGNIIWAIVLGLASVNILFFIWSGFAVTLRRRATRIKNTFKASESRFILLAGSENGSTLRFANAIHKQLLAAGERSYLAELNQYAVFPKAEHLLVFTSTHGLGDPPSNANKFAALVKQHPQQQRVRYSVVGFGSHAYPDFCGYAKSLDALLAEQAWAHFLLALHTVDDRSAEQFTTWVKAWSEKTQIPLSTTPASYSQKPGGLQNMMVLEKTLVTESDQTFLLTLRPPTGKFASGDLLAVYPGDEGKERFYSIGKTDGNIQLLVKLHPQGLGSGYLNSFMPGKMIKARILRNTSFHFPKQAPGVAMIAKGTGIAPFLGMIRENRKRTETHLYCGFRQETKLTSRYKTFAEDHLEKGYLKSFNMTFSREGDHWYVMDLVKRDLLIFTALFKKGGVVMICGSRAMQRDVEAVLDSICLEKNGHGIAHYKQLGQVLIDSY